MNRAPTVCTWLVDQQLCWHSLVEGTGGLYQCSCPDRFSESVEEFMVLPPVTNQLYFGLNYLSLLEPKTNFLLIIKV